MAGHVPGHYRGEPIASTKRLTEICAHLNLPFVTSSDSLSDDIFKDCFGCSLARRKLLFDLAEHHGCNKIALGHHADDIVETALLNILYSGKLSAILPKQPVLKGKMHIIRPLAYVWKEEIARYSKQRFGRLKTFSCPGIKDSRRQEIRKMLRWLQEGGAPVRENILRAISNPKWEYLPPAARPKSDGG
jgi:tRNA 2-thiocytidine biosynthesis protein TtcA